MHNHDNNNNATGPDGPREKLRAWKKGDADLPQHTLDNLRALEKSGDLKADDVALLRAYEKQLHRDPGPAPGPKPDPKPVPKPPAPKPPVPPVPPVPQPHPPGPPVVSGDSGVLQDLLGRVEAWVATAYADKGSIVATPDTLGQLMQPQGNLKAGDVVVLAPGTYGQQYVLSQKVDGTPGKPIVFVGSEGVVVTGVIAVDNPNTIAHGLLPSGNGRVRAGGFAVQVSFDQR